MLTFACPKCGSEEYRRIRTMCLHGTDVMTSEDHGGMYSSDFGYAQWNSGEMENSNALIRNLTPDSKPSLVGVTIWAAISLFVGISVLDSAAAFGLVVLAQGAISLCVAFSRHPARLAKWQRQVEIYNHA